MDDRDVERERRTFGITSIRLNSRLQDRAESERNLRRPWYPHINCARDGCGELARELWFFCSEACRNTYLQEHASEGAVP